MENNNVSNTDRLRAWLCYIPFVWIFFYFAEKNKSIYLSKHIKYWTGFFVWFILLRVVTSALFLWWLFFGWLLSIAYIWVAIYYWMKAYNWENFDIEIIDNMYPENKNWAQNTTNSNNSNTNSSQNSTLKEEFDENWNTNDSVVKTDNIVVNKIANGISNVVKNVKSDNKDEFAEDNSTKQEENKKNDDVLDF